MRADPARVPRATYRLQLHAGFTFADAAAQVPRLAAMGVSHVYCSPILQAAPGSTHGYDVVDPTRVNEELGGHAGLQALADAAHHHGMGLVVDVVPNHMALAGRANRWWWDVLEDGPASRFATFFDIDWSPPEEKLRASVLVPVLGDHYGRVLEDGQITLVREGGHVTARYFEHEVPISPRTLDAVLAEAAAAAGSDELAALARAFGRLPHAEELDPQRLAERHTDKVVLARWLERLCEEQPGVADAVDATLARWSVDPELLDGLLARQNHRLAWWRTAGHELDYRRFFDVTTLVALRMERPEVFTATHDVILDLVRDGIVDGLRIDHPDGLRDPAGYLEQLRSRAQGAWIVIEKILEPGERLPERWPVEGTTGYDALNRITSLFVDREGLGPLTDLWDRFTGGGGDWDEVARAGKLQIARDVLAADVERLVALLARVCERHRRHRDHVRAELRAVLREAVASFPVYRTYVRPGEQPADDDVERVRLALADVADRRPDLDRELLAFLEDVLVLRVDGTVERELSARFQQVTSAVMAKGVEDTAFYRWLRLSALNEVGGDPHHVDDVASLHEAFAEQQRLWPAAMVTTSTHDTKRSEDVRARLVALSEVPDTWAEAVWRWAHANERHRTEGCPDRAAELLLYQTLLGAHPLSAERAAAYMEKASREAKVHTSWVDPVPSYDDALRAFTVGVASDDEFLTDLRRVAEPIVAAGRVTSVAQKLLALTVPGVPDVYQGTELWDLSLVDPDNRRPVDHDRRAALVAQLDREPPQRLDPASDEEGATKLWTVRRALALRAEVPEAFGPGDAGGYEPLEARGDAADHAFGFVRGGRVAVLVPRLVLGLERRGGWGGTTVALPPGSWTDVLTGGRHEGGTIDVAELLARSPVALLRRT